MSVCYDSTIHTTVYWLSLVSAHVHKWQQSHTHTHTVVMNLYWNVLMCGPTTPENDGVTCVKPHADISMHTRTHLDVTGVTGVFIGNTTLVVVPLIPLSHTYITHRFISMEMATFVMKLQASWIISVYFAIGTHAMKDPLHKWGWGRQYDKIFQYRDG